MENDQPSSGSNVNGNASAPSESYVPPTTAPSQETASTSKHSRVTSTVARSFAADLDSMFGLSTGGVGAGGGGVDMLSQNVEERKKDVTTGQSELEQLEARLRETEQRLARVSRQNSPSRPQQSTSGATAADKNNTAALRGDGEQRQPHPLAQKPTFPADRPPTGQRQDTQQMMKGMPGAMPSTPGAGTPGAGRGEDYVMVDEGRGR